MCVISSGSITAFVLLCLIIHCTSTCVICCYTCLSGEGVDECCEVVGACCKVMGACCKEGGLCCKCIMNSCQLVGMCCEGMMDCCKAVGNGCADGIVGCPRAVTRCCKSSRRRERYTEIPDSLTTDRTTSLWHYRNATG